LFGGSRPVTFDSMRPPRAPAPNRADQGVSAPWRERLARALLIALVFSPGCVSLVDLPEMDWNPLLRVEHAPDGSVEVEALGPFVDLRDGPEGFSHAVRPFYQHKANGAESATDWLAPLGRTFTNRGGTKFRFWPFVWTGEKTDTPDGPAWQAVLFPLIFTGNGPRDDDGYFAFFPLAGRTRSLFGIDTFDFFLWPLFMRTRMNVTEESTSYTAFLLAGWTNGGPRDGSWRLLPFYRHRIVRHPDGTMRTDLKTVAWPFVTWGTDHMDSSSPSERWGIWPFASREVADTWRKTTVLWPFFRYNHQTSPTVEEGGDFLYDLPWPFFRWQRGPDDSTFRVFPFYSRRIIPDLDSTAFMIPFGWWRKSQGRTSEEGFPPVGYQRQDLYVLPFLHSSHRTVDGREGEDTEWQFWPLAHVDRGARGRVDAGALSLVPGRNIEFLKPADEMYSFLWTLWRHQSDGTRHETRLLFDTVMWRRGPEGTRVSVPFFYSRRPLAPGVASHQTLWGLLGAVTDESGLSRFSLAGFDLWAR